MRMFAFRRGIECFFLKFSSCKCSRVIQEKPFLITCDQTRLQVQIFSETYVDQFFAWKWCPTDSASRKTSLGVIKLSFYVIRSRKQSILHDFLVVASAIIDLVTFKNKWQCSDIVYVVAPEKSFLTLFLKCNLLQPILRKSTKRETCSFCLFFPNCPRGDP